MEEERESKIDEPFKPHPHLDDSVNEAIIKSEMEGGARLDKLEVGKKLRMRTSDRTYIIEKRPDGFYISGHPKLCPTPTKVDISGSVFHPQGSMLRVKFVGVGMFLEFIHPEFGKIITSEIQEVAELSGEEERITEDFERQVAEGVEEIKKGKNGR